MVGGGNGQNSSPKIHMANPKENFTLLSVIRPIDCIRAGDCVVFSPTNRYKTMPHQIISITRGKVSTYSLPTSSSAN